MRHKDKETALEALEAWKRLRAKVAVEGGENYDKPVLVQFLDRNTFEVMDRDIVEDEFYVLRKHRILRDLDPQGKDLEDAIRNARGGSRPAQPGRQQGRPQGKPSRRRPQGPQAKSDQPGNRREKDETRKGGNRRRRRRTGRRGPRRGNGGPSAGSPPPA
ncbi:MAG: hypothetical protein IPK87_01835 [Planctomycetes bacterium]|nr:hypothetical protein [Planctomycetota bacterium]